MLDDASYLVKLAQVFIHQVLQGAVDVVANLVLIGLLHLVVTHRSFTDSERHRVLVGVGEGFPRTKLELRRSRKRDGSTAFLQTPAIEGRGVEGGVFLI